MSDPKPDQRWQDSRYLSEHWGPTMLGQSYLTRQEYREAVTAAFKDLLAAESFGPKSAIEVLGTVMYRLSHRDSDHIAASRLDRQSRLKAAGGCVVCADSFNPDPATHQAFHDKAVAA